MSSNYVSKNLSHLGLVAGMYDQLEIGKMIDRLLPQDEEQQHISHGTCVKALILNGLGFVERRLYLVSHFFSDKPVEHLLGEGVEVCQLNDDRLGRCLDALQSFGLDQLFEYISHHACRQLGIDTQTRDTFLHLDSSSFHVDGAYNSEKEEDLSTIRICRGYSRDHRPDLNQVMLNLVVENSAGIPLQMEVLSGNTSDKTSFREQIARHIACWKAANASWEERAPVCWVADSALYTAETLQKISDHYWISRVPASIREAQEVIEGVSRQDMQVFKQEELKGYRYEQLGNQYAGIKQSWLLIFSSQAYEREVKTLKKNDLKGSLQECKALESLKKQVFHCPEDAQKALAGLVKQVNYTHLIDPTIEAVWGYAQAGRPSKDAQKQLLGYQVKAQIACSCQEYEKKRKKLGKFILATNDIEGRWSPEEVLKAYKGQSNVEKGFRFLKDKQFLASTLFVKKPERVEAILMIMTLCLMVYAALEKELRENLRQKEETLPNQLNQPIQNPTMRWIFALFTGIHCLYTDNQTLILNVNEIHRKVIKLMGKQIGKYYQIE